MKGSFFVNKTIRFLSLSLVGLLLTGALAACGKTPTAGGDGVIKKFSILTGLTTNLGTSLPPDIDINNNKWTDVFKKELPDIDIEWIIVPTNIIGERKNILMASGEFPDVITMSGDEMAKWADQGIIIELDNIHDKYYPNVYNFLNKDDLKKTRYNGHIYALCCIGGGNENPV